MMELVLKYSRRTRPILPLPFAVGTLQGAILERLPETIFTVTKDQVSLAGGSACEGAYREIRVMDVIGRTAQTR